MAHTVAIDIERECRWVIVLSCIVCKRGLSIQQRKLDCCPYCGRLPVQYYDYLEIVRIVRRWVYDVNEPTMVSGCEEEGHWEYKDEQKEAGG